MQVQIISNGTAAVNTAKDFINVNCTFLVSLHGEAYAVRYINEALFDYASVYQCKLHDKQMQISSESITQSQRLCEEVHTACISAFEEHFSQCSFNASNGWSIRSCMTLAEDSMTPRAESVIDGKYVSIFCDENAVDGNDYLVSVTPYNDTPDAFDYDVVENTPFTTSGWFATHEAAMQAYKTACIECIG